MAFTFVMAGGGSGGHVVPALAVARELRADGHHCVFVGVRRGMEAKLVPAEGFPIEWIETGALKRVGWRQMLATLAGLPDGVWQAARILDRVRPNAIFSMGGYVAAPVLLAALWKRIPVAMMEPNAVPGFTHRHLARYAARALVSFEETARWFPRGRTEVTGLPIREEFFAVPAKRPAAVVTVLITGGSQGSRTLNRAAEESWPLWKKGSVRLLHQTGAAMYEELAPRFHASGVEGEMFPFLSDMPRAFAEADIVVSRGGDGGRERTGRRGQAFYSGAVSRRERRSPVAKRPGDGEGRRRAPGCGRGNDRPAVGERGFAADCGCCRLTEDGRRGTRLRQARRGPSGGRHIGRLGIGKSRVFENGD